MNDDNKQVEKFIADLVAENKKLRAFKAYVHKRLDDVGVPVNVDPVETLRTGCRIKGRLSWLIERVPGLNTVYHSGLGDAPNDIHDEARELHIDRSKLVPVLPPHVGYVAGTLSQDRYTMRHAERSAPALFVGQWTPDELEAIAAHMRAARQP